MCRYKCSTFGKSFKNETTFFTHTEVTCQANRTWTLSSFPDTCECRRKCNKKVYYAASLQGLTVPIPLILQQKANFSFFGILNIPQLIMKQSSTNVMLVNITTGSQMISQSTIIHSPALKTTSSVNPNGPHVLTVSV